jgi:hypothetical protein
MYELAGCAHCRIDALKQERDRLEVLLVRAQEALDNSVYEHQHDMWDEIEAYWQGEDNE